MNGNTSSVECDVIDGEQTPEVLLVDEPLEATSGSARFFSLLGLVEVLLKEHARIDRVLKDDRKPAVLIPRFLAIALASYALFAAAMLIILNTASANAYPHSLIPIPPARWTNGSAVGLVVAYCVGLVAATGICLPSFYFFALLAGVRMSMLQIVGHVLRGKARSALFLVGILPIYVAWVLGLAVFGAPAPTLEICLYLGLLLPFVAGLEGVRCIYQGVQSLAETLPAERRCRRACFLRRLTFSWALCYTAVSPVMIYRLWELLA
jgi:hypothetical protein